MAKHCRARLGYRRIFRAAPLLLSDNLLLSTCFGTGCVTAKFTKPVASVKSSIETTASAVGTYFSELNSFERELYLEERVFDPQLRVEKTDTDGKPTPLVGTIFATESIKARTEAISLLGAYANRLAELAGSDAPQKFSSAAQALGTNVTSLISTFDKLSTQDTTAKSYIGPLSQILEILGELYLEQKRDALLKRAIKDGAPQVTTILDLLDSDLQNVVVPLRQTGIAQTLAVRVNNYNNTKDTTGRTVDAAVRRTSLSVAQRKELIDGIKSAAEQYDAFITSNPSEAISGIREAHSALLKYTDSNRKPKDFAELMAAIESLQDKADRVAAAVQRIRELRKGT